MRRERTKHPSIIFGVALILTLAVLMSTRWSPQNPHTSRAAGGAGIGTIASSDPGVPNPSTTSRPRTSPQAARKSSQWTIVPALTRAQLVARAVANVKAINAGLASGSISVAALNTVTGARFDYGMSSGMWTASVYKLLVLEALLVDNGGPLTGTEGSEAVPMIEQSDNVAGYQLYLDAGGRSGLAAAARQLGLKYTVPGQADPTFTTTSASDMITLLGNLVRRGPLTAASRSYALGLMRNVEADQRWGVGVTADGRTNPAIKNGWLSIDNSNGPGEDDDGYWAVSSVGVVTIKGQQVLMAVMTRHRPDSESGVRLVEKLARAIAPAVG